MNGDNITSFDSFGKKKIELSVISIQSLETLRYHTCWTKPYISIICYNCGSNGEKLFKEEGLNDMKNY